MRVHVADHHLITHNLTVLCDAATPSSTFRALVKELVTLLAYEATGHVRVEPIEIMTPVGREERAQQVGRLGRQDTADDLRAGVEPAVPDHVPERADGTGLRVVGAVHQPGHAGEDQRAGAHRAGLERHDERAAVETPAAERCRGRPNRDYLRVRGGIVICIPGVAPAANDHAVRADDDGANGDLTDGSRGLRFSEGLGHPGSIALH